MTSPLAGIGARLRAKQHWERVYIPSPLVGEGEDGGEDPGSPPPVSSPAKGEDVGLDVPHTLPILILAPMPYGRGRGEGQAGTGRVLTGPIPPYADVKTALAGENAHMSSCAVPA